MKNTLNFRNAIQVALWDEELRGQISDGYWENALPYEHYIPWCRCETAVDPLNLGRNFWANKDNYDLNSPSLLSNDIVRDRMLAICRAVAGEGFTVNMMRGELIDMKKIIRKPRKI